MRKDRAQAIFLKRTNGTKLLAIYRNDSRRRKWLSAALCECFCFFSWMWTLLGCEESEVRRLVLIPFVSLLWLRPYERGLRKSAPCLSSAWTSISISPDDSFPAPSIPGDWQSTTTNMDRLDWLRAFEEVFRWEAAWEVILLKSRSFATK